MPDDEDYEQLRRLLADPVSWTTADLNTARLLLRSQLAAISQAEACHPARVTAMREVASELETAIARWEKSRQVPGGQL